LVDKNAAARKKRRSQRVGGADGRTRINQMAIALIYSKGYRGLTMRGLAKKLGIQGASLYYHLSSKQELLRTILLDIQEEQNSFAREAVEAAGPSPVDQLRAAIRAHLRYHVDHRPEAFISDSELRDLTPANRRIVVASRDRYEEIFRDVIRRGSQQGYWEADGRLAGFIVIAMCTGVNTWYRPDGPLGLDEIADYYADFVLRALGGRPLVLPTGELNTHKRRDALTDVHR
jgi:AcrR family transcriptional regulator